jgi:hypothetical protein
MPGTTITISGAQREAIYQFVLDRLSRLADLPLAVKQEDFATARRLAREFSGDFRLLEDLGWGEDERRDVALTIAPEWLAETLRRLHADAEGALSGSPGEREAREAEEALRRRDQLVLDTASGLLVELLVDREEEGA